MKNILNRIKNRAKRLLWVMILLPIITGVIGYIFESQQPVTYTATAEIILGNFENERYTDQKFASDKLKTKEYIKKIQEKEGLPDTWVSEVLGKLQVSPLATKMIVLSYTSTDQIRGEEIVNIVKDYFLSESNKKFSDKQEHYAKVIKELDKVDTSGDALASINKIENYDKADINLLNLQATELSEDVKVNVNQPNPMNRATLGFLLGLMINIIILVTPEIFREEPIRD
ncbi:hypothetical protein V7147_02610 [Bacillus sp. JJ1521]|uniref:hypothetical protein n=1 Tax=Bacillus sp. JJ1521 TaxID=3122957 RepID=UPI002FFDCAA6